MRRELGRVGSKQFEWEQLLALFEKLPRWASYSVAILCSVGMGYSLGSARSALPDPRQDQITLIVVSAGAFALLAIFLLGLILRREERRRAERAEQLRLSKEATAVELLDQVDRHVLDALDNCGRRRRTGRTPGVQHLAGCPSRESRARGLSWTLLAIDGKLKRRAETSAEWLKTLPAWLETLPGSLDVMSR